MTYYDIAIECGIHNQLLALVKSNRTSTRSLFNAFRTIGGLLEHVFEKLPIEFIQELLSHLFALLDTEDELTLTATVYSLELTTKSGEMIPMIVQMGNYFQNLK